MVKKTITPPIRAILSGKRNMDKSHKFIKNLPKNYTKKPAPPFKKNNKSKTGLIL